VNHEGKRLDAEPFTLILAACDEALAHSIGRIEAEVRFGTHFVHVVWDGRSRDMVEFHEEAHDGECASAAMMR
jgi:hypothetical protein